MSGYSTIDLHTYTAPLAQVAIGVLLQDFVSGKRRVEVGGVHIITGMGNNSATGFSRIKEVVRYEYT